MPRFAPLLLSSALLAQTGVLVNRYDPAVTGSATHETVLKPANVNAAHFGKLYSYYVDGAVYAQPLYLRDPDLLFVATMNDKVYAFPASHKGTPVWMRDFTDEMKGVTPVPVMDITNNPELNIVGNVGIEGTPVIDAAAGALFFVTRTKENGAYVQRIHKLNVRTGADLAPAVEIETAPGAVRFDARAGNQRSALVLVNGRVVVAWASHEDIRPYHGWIMAFDEATLKRTGALCLTPDGADGGVWQSGRPPAMDSDGNVYFEVGNGSWNGDRDFGNSLLKLRVTARGIAVADYFTPHDWEELNRRDADLGSTGPLLIPGTDLLVAGAKNGTLYLFDRKNLGRRTDADTAVLQTIAVDGGRPLAGPAYWDRPAGGMLYLWCDADVLKAFRFDGKRLSPEPVMKGTVPSKGSPGGALTVSSDGGTAGSAIVWAALTNGKSADHGNAAGILRAYNAETLEELWNSEQQRRRDRLGTLVKFVPPLVVNGRVYLPNYDNAVNVYGTFTPER